MSYSYPPARTGVQYTSGNPDQQLLTMSQVVNDMIKGHLNTTIFVTLTPNATSTTITDSRISAQTCCCLCPTTADAAAALATTYVVCTNGQMVIHHASAASVDRTFTAGIFG